MAELNLLKVKAQTLPEKTLLERYHSMPGAYTDCFSLRVDAAVTHSEFITAFYTSFLFRVERVILKFGADKPSTDQQVLDLAAGDLEQFAAWSVEQRTENQLLMCDFIKRTRSWLMVKPIVEGGVHQTILYFGSAIVPVKNPKTGVLELGLIYRLLLGFHRVYSRLLLAGASARLKRI